MKGSSEHGSKKTSAPGSALGFGREHDAKNQRHRPKCDVGEIDWSGLFSVEQDRPHAAANQPNRAQQNENKHRNPPRTLKAMPTLRLSEKFTPRASGPSINGHVRLRGHTGRMTRSSNQAGQTRVVAAGMKWPSSGTGGEVCAGSWALSNQT